MISRAPDVYGKAETLTSNGADYVCQPFGMEPGNGSKDEPFDLTAALAPLDGAQQARLVRLIALGQIAENAASMELALRQLVAALLGSPRALVVTGEQTVSWLVDNAIAVLKRNDEIGGQSLGEPTDVKAFEQAIQRCRALNELRNRAMHGAWADNTEQQVISRRHNPHMISIETPVAELQQLATNLSRAHVELMQRSMKISGLWLGTPVDD
jgi:hypothetical protein